MTKNQASMYKVILFLVCSYLLSACLDTPGEEFIPPYEEELSEDGGMYTPQQPNTSSGYGSGASGSGASGSGTSGSGAQNKELPADQKERCQEQDDPDHSECDEY